ncbi:hypothetical protein P7K49_015599, partial [Saguinus oedipus]
ELCLLHQAEISSEQEVHGVSAEMEVISQSSTLFPLSFCSWCSVAEPGPFCRVQLCACDRKLVYCLKRNLWSYNPRYQYFPNILCF